MLFEIKDGICKALFILRLINGTIFFRSGLFFLFFHLIRHHDYFMGIYARAMNFFSIDIYLLYFKISLLSKLKMYSIDFALKMNKDLNQFFDYLNQAFEIWSMFEIVSG